MTEQAQSRELACSLSDKEQQARRAMARTRLVSHIIETQEIEGGIRLTFSESDVVRSDVEMFVSLERQCCGFLTFTTTPPGEGLTLTMEGPEEAGAIISSFIEQIQSH